MSDTDTKKRKRKAKKKPTRQPVKKENVTGVKTRSDCTRSVTLPDDSDFEDLNSTKSRGKKQAGALKYLRHSAKLFYVTWRDEKMDLSVAKMSKMAPYSRVSEDTLIRWCREDGWVAAKQEFFQRIGREIQEHVGNKLVEAKVQQIERLQGVLDLAIKDIENGIAEPKSLEGMIGAVTKLWNALSTEQDRLASGMVPNSMRTKENNLEQVAPELGPEEARAASKAIVRMRKAKIEAEVKASQTEPEQPADKPKLRVVDNDG